MTAEIRDFLLESLAEMKYSTDEIGEDTVLGPAGADLESLALAELALRVEDEYGVRFEADEAEAFAGLTVGEFCAVVAQRISTSAAT
ncbi:phosphopantetheine-binding-protein [Saccharothrix sp. NRRL B-16348]|uniref:acyl carrier protein n=1 Tax=Saccharothrix sp. NRRL B-16348 TaxID=1415542 RepID=UPI0006AEC5DB|nr:acyl carrier protein [Saccharothrix sp. NRRL B-16348]KOX21749.1 phosphopantetheine-binding-protein [Saccharothrix sp. NRRL B-16348]